MYFTTHLVAGMSLGAAFANPIAAGAVGLASHAALDMIPHHDYEGAKEGVIDLAAGLLAFSVLHPLMTPHGASNSSLWAGAIAATIPDLEVVIAYLSGKTTPLYFPTHSGLLPHRHLNLPWGAVIQFIVTGVSLAAAFLALGTFAS